MYKSSPALVRKCPEVSLKFDSGGENFHTSGQSIIFNYTDGYTTNQNETFTLYLFSMPFVINAHHTHTHTIIVLRS